MRTRLTSMDMFSLPDLAMFIAVAETGSVRAAAERVCRTQSAVSQALQRLEIATSLSLLDRNEYRIRLTDRGRQFERRARNLLKETEALHHFVRILATGTEQRVRVAIHGAIGTSVWADIIANVGEDYPDTTLEVVKGEVDRPMTLLNDGIADLALLVQPPSDPRLSATVSLRIGVVRFIRVVRSDRIHRLAELPQIIVSDFEETSASYGVLEGRRYCRVSDHATKADLILRGCGWGAVPDVLVGEGMETGLLTPIESPGSASSTHEVFMYRIRDRPCGPVASALWDAFNNRASC